MSSSFALNLSPSALRLLAIAFFLATTTSASAQQKAKPLPEGAEKKTVTIYSDGTKMIGDLYLPAGFQKGQ